MSLFFNLSTDQASPLLVFSSESRLIDLFATASTTTRLRRTRVLDFTVRSPKLLHEFTKICIFFFSYILLITRVNFVAGRTIAHDLVSLFFVQGSFIEESSFTVARRPQCSICDDFCVTLPKFSFPFEHYWRFRRNAEAKRWKTEFPRNVGVRQSDIYFPR